jgi:hypothetical protein
MLMFYQYSLRLSFSDFLNCSATSGVTYLCPTLDESLLTVGQLQWMDYELFLPALKPLFLSKGIPPSRVDRIINLAQHDLYHPSVCQFTRLHIVYAFKCLC